MKKNYPLAIITFLFGIFLFLFFNSCTQNQRAKKFEADSAETYTFQEASSFGILEGTYIIRERK